MSHHEQNKGPHEHRQSSSFNVQNQADQLLLQQSLTTNPHIHMSNLNQQGNNNWHRYYSQIGDHSRQQLPFMENSQFPLTLNSYSSAIQRSNNIVMSGQNIQSGGVMMLQPHQQLYNHQQQPVSSASTASVSDLASLAQQQYLIMTQQQQYLQQHQQYVGQSIQDPVLEQHPITNSIQSMNYPSTSAANLNAISQSSQKITANTDYINQPIFQESIKKSFEITEQSQNLRSKSLENANIMAQKALEAHAEAKAQEAFKKSQAIQDELKRKQNDAKEHAQIVKEHIQSFNDPINLAGCHTLSKVSMYLPFPTEMAFTSNTLLPCFDQKQAVLVLSNDDLSLTNYLGALLADTTNHINKIKLKHEESELCNLEGIPELPALIYAVDAQHGTAFVINDETNLQEACNSTTNIKNSELDDKTNVEFTYASHQVINYSSNIDSSGAHLKKKKDMAESLHDSLSGYFSTSHQNRNRTDKCNNDDEDHVSITSAERENEEQFGLIKDEKMVGGIFAFSNVNYN